MDLEKEIRRAIKHISVLDMQTQKTQEELESVFQRVLKDINDESYHFDISEKIVLKKTNKRRLVKRYADQYSSENILCQFIKQVLDKDFQVRYPNRNKITKSLFEVLNAIKQMADFTICKFDFRDYFNSLSSEYVFKKYLQSYISDRMTSKIVEDFCMSTEYTYAGFPTSNAMAEIIASEFDIEVKRVFLGEGIVFYERYIDDGLLIFNRYIDNTIVKEKLNSILKCVFYDQKVKTKTIGKTSFNTQKSVYINSRMLKSNPSTLSFDFLGYEFYLKSGLKNIEIQYGITLEKRNKYQDKLNQIIKTYFDASSPDYMNMELLRHRVAAFSSREVYLGTKHRSNVWKVKGFISNYSELRFLLEIGVVHSDTLDFLQNAIEESFKNFGFTPYFISGAPKNVSGYNLYHNMMVNKTILLVDGIGYSYQSLIRLCKQIGISAFDSYGKKRSYNSLVREYLIKVNVGY